MPRVKSRNSSSGLISHYNAVRMRVTGTGALKLTMFSLDDENFVQLPDMQMAERTNRMPVSLVTFTEQRASLELKTLTINDYFRVDKIVIYTKFFAVEYPA